jgi:DNA-binding NarL/FixJ family response regulator
MILKKSSEMFFTGDTVLYSSSQSSLIDGMADCAQAVLIVDDSSTIRGAIRNFLENVLHMNVCGEAENGLEAIEKAKEQKPGLILMDLSMPRMNGAVAASIIKKHVPETRIIVFTLFMDAMSQSMAKATGVDVVVSKTEGASGLTQALRRLITTGSTPATEDKLAND